jgi:hypothetical protein
MFLKANGIQSEKHRLVQKIFCNETQGSGTVSGASERLRMEKSS